MKSFPQRVAHCAGLVGGQSELARRVSKILGREVKPQVIQYLANAEAEKPARSSRYTWAIAQAANVNESWLARGIGAANANDPPAARETPSLYVVSPAEHDSAALLLPKFNAVGSAGRGRFPPDYDEVVDTLTISGPWARKNLAFTSVDKLAVLTAYGDSMEPTFSGGDPLLVDTGVREIKIDAVYVLLRDDELFVKRVQRQLDGRLKIISDNKNYESQVLSNGERGSFDVLGRVIYCWKGKRL